MTTIDTHAAGAATAVASSAGPPGVGRRLVDHHRPQADRSHVHRRLARRGRSVSMVVAVLLGIERIDAQAAMLDVDSVTAAVRRLPGRPRLRRARCRCCSASLSPSCRCSSAPARWRSPAWPLPGSGPGSSASVLVVDLASPPTAARAAATPQFVELYLVSQIVAGARLCSPRPASLATSVLTTRAPGMNMRRVPLFTWSVARRRPRAAAGAAGRWSAP